MAGDAISAYGSFEQGKQDKAAAEYNARNSEQEAVYAVQKAASDERQQRVVSKKFLGDIRSSIGASGITTEGTALDVLEESAGNAELDALMIRHEGAVRAVGLRNQATYQRVAGENAQKNANLRGAAYLAKSGEKAYEVGGG